MKYHVISEKNPKTFSDKVTAALENGWRLHGHLLVVPGPADAYSEASFQFSQALTREDYHQSYCDLVQYP